MGYIRKTLEDYDINSDNKFIYLVNHGVQQHHPNYEKLKETTHWIQDQFEDYMLNHQNYSQNQLKLIYSQIQEILTQTFLAFYNSQPNLKQGGSQLFGADIMIDENLNVKLIEINKNPYLKLSTVAHQKVIPKVLSSWLDTNQLQKDRKQETSDIEFLIDDIVIPESEDL